MLSSSEDSPVGGWSASVVSLSSMNSSIASRSAVSLSRRFRKRNRPAQAFSSVLFLGASAFAHRRQLDRGWRCPCAASAAISSASIASASRSLFVIVAQQMQHAMHRQMREVMRQRSCAGPWPRARSRRTSARRRPAATACPASAARHRARRRTARWSACPCRDRRGSARACACRRSARRRSRARRASPSSRRCLASRQRVARGAAQQPRGVRRQLGPARSSTEIAMESRGRSGIGSIRTAVSRPPPCRWTAAGSWRSPAGCRASCGRARHRR